MNLRHMLFCAQAVVGGMRQAGGGAIINFGSNSWHLRHLRRPRIRDGRGLAMTFEPHCVWALGAELGEGPVWHGGALWFVDIKGRAIHRFGPEGRGNRSWSAPAPPGFVVPSADGQWIAGLKTGLHRFEPAGGVFTLLSLVEPAHLDNRLNDGFVDAKGRLWFGSMHDPEEATSGALYRFDHRGAVYCDGGYCITNGPAMSPDGRTLYHTDTLRKTIYAFDVDAVGGLSHKRVFTVIEEGAGYPDGPTVDAEGCLWTGLFGGWGARRYSPAGELLHFVRFPVANVTKLAFGGPGLTTAFATTAWKGLTPAERADQPEAGGLFAFEVAVPGLPQYEVRYG